MKEGWNCTFTIHHLPALWFHCLMCSCEPTWCTYAWRLHVLFSWQHILFRPRRRLELLNSTAASFWMCIKCCVVCRWNDTTVGATITNGIFWNDAQTAYTIHNTVIVLTHDRANEFSTLCFVRALRWSADRVSRWHGWGVRSIEIMNVDYDAALQCSTWVPVHLVQITTTTTITSLELQFM